MNLRHFTLALLISALPIVASAGSATSFEKGDFVAATQVTRHGETLLRVKLSKSGKAKLRKLNRTSVNKKIHIEVAGVSSDFTLKEPIRGARMEMGPYSAREAGKVAAEINHQK